MNVDLTSIAKVLVVIFRLQVSWDLCQRGASAVDMANANLHQHTIATAQRVA